MKDELPTLILLVFLGLFGLGIIRFMDRLTTRHYEVCEYESCQPTCNVAVGRLYFDDNGIRFTDTCGVEHRYSHDVEWRKLD